MSRGADRLFIQFGFVGLDLYTVVQKCPDQMATEFGIKMLLSIFLLLPASIIMAIIMNQMYPTVGLV